VALAVALHAAAVALAVFLREPARKISPAPAPPKPFPVRLWRLPSPVATGAPARVPRRASAPRAWGAPAAQAEPARELRVPEREIIDQGHGVTMTIEGGGAADAGEPGDSARRGPPLNPDRRWLRMVVWVGSTLTAPRPSQYCVPRIPEMPEEAVELGITGRVEASYEVDARGVVGEIAVEGSPPPLLAEAVRRWLSGCLFEPSVQDGRRTPARVRQTFVFRIR
jgi:hypothetical protein